nr:uncharacterized protein LOC115264414 [Aedes albopictus]
MSLQLVMLEGFQLQIWKNNKWQQLNRSSIILQKTLHQVLIRNYGLLTMANQRCFGDLMTAIIIQMIFVTFVVTLLPGQQPNIHCEKIPSYMKHTSNISTSKSNIKINSGCHIMPVIIAQDGCMVGTKEKTD